MRNKQDEKQRRLWQLLVLNADGDDMATNDTLNNFIAGYGLGTSNYMGEMFYPGSGHPSCHSNTRLVNILY